MTSHRFHVDDKDWCGDTAGAEPASGGNLLESDDSLPGVAIVGMACRFPGVRNIDEFWQVLRTGTETISFFSEKELQSFGVSPAALKDPDFVKAKGVLEDIEYFDAGFFGFSPREAELTDPQQRVFMECAWSALEDAGYNPEAYAGTIGAYAGAGWNSYLLFNLAPHSHLLESETGHQVLLGNEKDNLATRVSYKLNLKGPSITIQTGCSTSLVAVALACQGLRNFQCDMALAGGVSISVPQTGYVYRPGGIMSPDGHCRAFDAKARGTVIGSGAGVVVLKRLEDALADGDGVYAVIKGTGINNDGSLKPGYTAPSVDGQARAIVEAHEAAAVHPDSISYVEAHGTGTILGDPIEVAALTKAFRAGTERKQFCAIGSVKTNIGHLDAAAGVAGLIKTSLAIKHGQIPPSLHFEKGNPEIDFAGSPFYVNTTLCDWASDGAPRRAGVSSFGLGGTNAHLILEEAPIAGDSRSGRPQTLVTLSARTKEALEKATSNLLNHFKQRPESELADVAYTLHVGRKSFDHRRVLVCENADDVIAVLETRNPERLLTGAVTQDAEAGTHGVAFMFSGQGAQYANMGRNLYESEQVFRTHADNCFDVLKVRHNLDLRGVLYPSHGDSDKDAERLRQTENTQPALFVVEYALAQLWMSWGITMRAAIGHSIGEYVAATLAGVFSLEDGLSLVTERGRLIQMLPAGAMLAVALPEKEVVPLLGENLSLAAVNETSSCVVSGPTEAIQALQQQLVSQGVYVRYLNTSHAFHSRMVEPAAAPFADCLRTVRFNPPRIPFVSNVTGTWIEPFEAMDANYWVRHLTQTVRFADGLGRLLSDTKLVLLEVGPGRTLTQFARRHPGRKERVVLSSLRHPQEQQPDSRFLLTTLARLWLSGVEVDWSAFHRDEERRRVPLPTYPFDRERYWIEPPNGNPGDVRRAEPTVDSIWESLIEGVRAQAEAEVDGFDQRNHVAKRECLDDVCVAYLKLALRRLGLFCIPGQTYSQDEILARTEIVPHYRQLFLGWLEVLEEAGQLRKDDAGLLVDVRPSFPDSAPVLLQEARVRWADTPQVVDLVEHCGEALVDVALGEQNPLELFSQLLERSENEAQPEFALHTQYKTILRNGLEHVVKALPSTGRLRILEIGAGTGIATAELLPILPPERTSYVFTDLARLFLSQARRKFKDYPFVTYGLLDIEKSPVEQGYPLEAFDVIVAVNVLHAVREIDNAVANVRSLLAPGGLLLIGEITQATPDFVMTYGLLMNPVDDPHRSQSNPFLTTERWREVLRANRFPRVGTFPESSLLGHHVLVAQATTTTLSKEPSNGAVKPAFVGGSRSPHRASGLLKKPDISEWFHVPSWKRSVRPDISAPAEVERPTECWLIFADQLGLGISLADRLESQRQSVFTVVAGKELNRPSPGRFAIDPRRPEDYETLIRDLRAQGKTPGKIVHLWSVTAGNGSELSLESLEDAQFLGLYSLLFLMQAIGAQELTEALQMWVVSNGAHEVMGDEVSVEKALLLAPCKVIPLEYPNVRCSAVDVVVSECGIHYEQLIERLMGEIRSAPADPVVAYRGSHRWVQTSEAVRLPRPAEINPRLKKNGVYLITGGLGKVGLTIAEYLAEAVQAKLILTGRSEFLQRERWEEWLRSRSQDDSRGQIIAALRRLESLGSEVLVVTADVSDLEQMEAAVSRAEARFGAINGVIHSAGVLGDGAIQHKTIFELKNVLAAKVAGTMVLHTIFKDRKEKALEFLVLFSSLSAFRPGFGQLAYSAANNFLGAFVHSRFASRHGFTACIDWDVWQGEGMAYDATAPSALQRLKEEDFRLRGILPREGMDVFNRVLGSTLPQVLVSTSEYLSVLEEHDGDLSQLYLETLKATAESSSKHSRPDLTSNYALPESETERTLVGIWQELLGIDRIGIDDDFFELGGDSLIGTQVITRIQRSFGVKVATRCVYTHPTVRSMSEVIEATLVSQSSPETIRELIRKMELGDKPAVEIT